MLLNYRPEVTITIVSWNTQDLLRDCLKSLLAENVKQIAEVHVVDNNSHDGSPEMVRREFPEVRLFANSENLGFARANNQSWRESKGRYWLLLNSDTIVKLGAIEKLIAFMDAHPRAGMATAKLLNTDGTPQFCAEPDVTISKAFLDFFRLHLLLPAKLRGKVFQGRHFSYDEAQKLDTTWGTALIARREAVEEAGPLSEEFFMYGEDMEWSLRIRRKGWEIWFCPEAEIIHFGGQSSNQVWDNRGRSNLNWEGCYRALRLHRGETYVKALQVTFYFMTLAELAMDNLFRRQTLINYHRAKLDYHSEKLFGASKGLKSNESKSR
jgi:hypothetical protein